LQLRIKKLVFHIFDVSSTKGLEECFVLPDWQFVQYMLPCFVTLIGHLATDSKTKPTEVFACIRFVHNLIQSYELNLITKHVKGEPAPLVRERDPDFPSWVCFNLARNLQMQMTEVEKELGLLIYGSCKRIKKAGMPGFLEEHPGLLQLFGETLNRSWFGKLSVDVFRSWCEKVLQCVPRLKAAIAKEVTQPTNPFPINNLLEALSTLQQLVHYADVCCMDEPQVGLERATLHLAHQKLKKMMGKEQVTLNILLNKQFFLQMQKLTVQQLLGLALFDIAFCHSKVEHSMLAFVKTTQVPQSALLNAAVEKFENKDWSGLKSLLTPLLSDQEGNDLSVVEMDIAVNTAQIGYNYVLQLIEEKDSWRDDFLSLVPVLPVRFCRGCEKFTDVQLSMCRVCVDNRDFPDVHWFCSHECEETVLAQRHLQEHDVFLMKLLGLV
jgi:hypothetical protein